MYGEGEKRGASSLSAGSGSSERAFLFWGAGRGSKRRMKSPILKDDKLEWSDDHGREWPVNVQNVECRCVSRGLKPACGEK